MTLCTLLLVFLSGLAAALASSVLASATTAIYPEIMGCEAGCAVAAGGWPVPYIIDYPGISVAGSADLLGLLTGEDRFSAAAFLATALFWTLVASLAVLLWRRGRM